MSNTQKDILIAILLFMVGWIAMFYTLHNAATPQQFYQSQFEPAVMAACGYGFGVNPAGAPTPVSAFLEQKTTHFSCENLKNVPPLERNIPLRAWYYLVMAVAGIWSIAGISWPVVNILTATLCGLAVSASFAIFRLAMGRITAAIGALIFALSSYNLRYGFYLRDYAKTPFLLAGIFILALLVLKPLRYQSQAFLVLILGIVIGVGYGFRADLLALLPISIMTLIFFLPGAFTKEWGYRLGLIALLLVCFGIAALPMFATYQHTQLGSCLWHFINLGLSSPFTEKLKLVSSFYDMGQQFSDSLESQSVVGYGKRAFQFLSVPYCSQTYDFASFHQYKDIVTTFPADILTRALASIRGIFQYVHLALPMIAFLGVIAWYNLRIGIFVSLGAFYFFGYPAIQYSGRHYFYLAAFCWLPVGFFLTQLYQHGKQLYGSSDYHWNSTDRFRVKKSAQNLAIFLLFWAMLIGIPFMGARWYQQQQVSALITTYLNAPIKPVVTTSIISNGATSFQFKWPENLWVSRGDEHAKLLRISLDEKTCAGLPSLTVTYEYRVAQHDFAHTVTPVFSKGFSAKRGGATTLFMPLYFIKDASVPKTVEVPSITCIPEFSEAIPPDFYPLWITLQIPSDWKQRLTEYRQSFL